MIDNHIKRPWPPEVLAAVARFKQGDVVERPPFFYARHPTLEVFDAGGPQVGESQIHELHPDDAPPYGIITTQTCDVAEQGEPMQPWLSVSPVYAATDQQLIAKGYAVELTGPFMGRYVADLRIELPLEKSVLVGREAIPGFATEAEAEAFGRLLGVRRARAALANELVEAVIRMLARRRNNNRNRARRVWEQLWRLGLQIEEGTRLRPIAVRVHAMCNGPPSQEVREWFDDWEDRAREEADTVQITLHTTSFHDATCMDARLVEALIQLDT